MKVNKSEKVTQIKNDIGIGGFAQRNHNPTDQPTEGQTWLLIDIQGHTLK